MKDFKPDIAVVHLLDPQDTTNTDTASLILDTAGFDGAALAVSVGTITTPAADAYLTPEFQESDTIVGTDFATVAAADLNGAFTKIDATSEDQVTQVVGYRGSKRYLRANLNYTGANISAALVSVVGILGYPDKFPATAPAAITAT